MYEETGDPNFNATHHFDLVGERMNKTIRRIKIQGSKG